LKRVPSCSRNGGQPEVEERRGEEEERERRGIHKTALQVSF
jgi:hypothetical protein